MEIENYPAISSGSAFTRASGKNFSGREPDNSAVHPSPDEQLARAKRPVDVGAIQSTVDRFMKDSMNAGFDVSRDNVGAKTRQALNAYHTQIDMEASDQKTEFSRVFGIDFYV